MKTLGWPRISFIWLLVCLTGTGRAEEPPLLGFTPASTAQQRSREQQMLRQPSVQQIDAFHRMLAATPHYAGTPANAKLADDYAEQLRRFGFEVMLTRYEVLLPRPLLRQITVLSPQPQALKLTEVPYPQDPDTSNPNLWPPFNAYAADGDVTAEVVYVNNGLPEDYQTLDKLGISVQGKIVLARYGRAWRGVKVRLAEDRGAVGCLLYSDPAEDGAARGPVLPQGKWRPDSGVQTGSVLNMPLYPGDPQTPMRPSKPGVERLPLKAVPTLPKIPALPISAGDALPILRQLQGPIGPKPWQGGLKLTYHIGPGPVRIHLQVKSDWSVRPIVNVIGVLRGQAEPDQIVMVGSHRDAWGFGGADPLSGSALLLETARVLGEQVKQGYRPRRSIAIASWDAEEYGFIGSTEYGEEFAQQLPGHLVAYLNREDYSSGDFGAAGTPSLQSFLNQVAAAVSTPDGKQTLQAAWRKTAAAGGTVPPGDQAQLWPLGAGSDYTVFLNHLGIPSAEVGFFSGNGSYHSRFDTRWFFTTYGDPGWAYGERLTEFVLLFLSRLADAEVLPLDYTRTADAIAHSLTDLNSLVQAQKLDGAIDLSRLTAATMRLKTTAAQLNGQLTRRLAQNPPGLDRQQLAQVNQRLLQAELAFLDPQGLPGRPWYRHQLYAPGYNTGYQAETLPALRSAIQQKDIPAAQQAISRLAQTLDRVNQTLQAAAAVHF